MKRKMIAALLTAVMTCSMSATAFAQQATTNTTLNKDITQGSTTVSHTVAETYTITIPNSVTFDSASENPTQAISASEVFIAKGKQLNVKVTSTNYDNEGQSFQMKTTAGDALKYGINIGSAGGTTVKSGDSVLSVAAGTQTGDVTLYYSLTTPTKAGDYTDTLTFTSSVDDVLTMQ